MSSITFHPDRSVRFSSAASQQTSRTLKRDAASANTECDRPSIPQVYAARGVVYGLLISVPLWVIIGGAVFLAYKAIG